MADSFLTQCRENYYNGITPSNKLNYEKEGYKNIVALSKEYFDDNRYEDFAGSFIEGKYLIPLWAAHMLIEHGNPSQELINKSLEIIKDYSNNPLAPDVAKEEKEWLMQNGYDINK